jgi:chromosome segregation ATPase
LEEDLIHRVANLETGIHEFKTGIQEFKTGVHEFKTEIKADTKEWKAEMKELEKDMNTLKTGVKESDMEKKGFQHDIVQKLDFIRTELTQSQNNLRMELTSAITKQLAAYSLDQQKQFSNLYFRGLFTVSLTPYVIY